LSTQRVIYLHGFASSPSSRKAQFFGEKLSQEGFSVETPDLAAGDFEHLTLSGQLQIVEKLLAAGPAVLFGSSMGGYLAALAAARHPGLVERVVLLAPAFGFYDLWKEELGQEKLETWRKNGTIAVFHYGEGKELPLAFGLMEDAAQFEAFPEIRQRGLLFHGLDDPLVPIEQSRRYVAGRQNIHLMEFKSGHELTDVLDGMWKAARGFLLEGV
jgi:pimeloyl-ACP methyl ester carboxylesterase